MSETNEVLAVMSKVKAYIKSSGMNTAGTVANELSDRIKKMCDGAIENARAANRKTVMDKDFN